jgi:hypothetical protein
MEEEEGKQTFHIYCDGSFMFSLLLHAADSAIPRGLQNSNNNIGCIDMNKCDNTPAGTVSQRGKTEAEEWC